MTEKLEDKFRNLANEIISVSPQFQTKIGATRTQDKLSEANWGVFQDEIYAIITKEVQEKKVLFLSNIGWNLDRGFSQPGNCYASKFLNTTYPYHVKKGLFLANSFGSILEEIYSPFEIKLSPNRADMGRNFSPKINSIVFYSDLESVKKYVEEHSKMVKTLQISFVL